MMSMLQNWRRCRGHILAGLAGPVLVSLATGAEPAAAPAPAAGQANANAAGAPAKTVSVLDLCACRQIALEKQPTLAAAHAHLAASEARLRGLDELVLAAVVRHDLPIRRQQAARGVHGARAALNQAEIDAGYAVTRTYLSALYTLQQQQVADDSLADLEDLHKFAEDQVKAGERKDITKRHVERIETYMDLARARREVAVQGHQRALAALREAMGVGCDFSLAIAARPLPEPHPEANRDQLVALTLARRGEIVQATLYAEVVCLEVEAQGELHGTQGQTFASSVDIHARPIPAGDNGVDYSPAALGPEMPTSLPGNKGNRVDQAKAYHARAVAVVDKTRGLLTLECEDAWFRLVEASRRKQLLLTARDRARKYADAIRDDFREVGGNGADKKPRESLNTVLDAGVLAAQTRVEYNQALYQYDLELAALERITGGGFCAGFDPLLCNPP